MPADEKKFIEPGPVTRAFNRLVMLINRTGAGIAGSRTLAVRGRKSGEFRTTPVNPLEHEGATYLVAPRGTTQWVRNLRAAGSGELRSGRKAEPFRAEEVPDTEKLPILKDYLDKWAWEVGAFFELEKDHSDADIRRIAPQHPVFKIRTGS